VIMACWQTTTYYMREVKSTTKCAFFMHIS
jgi:hypothetical protein